ncbi:BglG family transcription antiterminator [Virgibacillus kekensis]|uniref:BglG family transcription antiterminator n=1 Tax=Virgibacillus kekensis TaxID=202261 RepID=A0ABV9DHZ6_9BACI
MDKRRAHLLSVILHSSEPVHSSNLAEKLGVSQRTIYYDVGQINDWLESQRLESIRNIHGEGFWFNRSMVEKVDLREYDLTEEYVYQYSENERKLIILLTLLTGNEKTTMRTFIDLTFMSRGTINKDLGNIKNQLADYELELQYSRANGYKLCGSEENKRKLLLSEFSNIMLNREWRNIRSQIYNMLAMETNNKKDADSHEKINALIYKAEEELSLRLTDEMFEMLSINLLITVHRAKLGQFVEVDSEEARVLQNTEHYKASMKLTAGLMDLFAIEFPDDEISFLTMNLLGLKIHREKFNSFSSSEIAGLRIVVRQMIADFQTYACVIFDDRDGLENNLLTHIKPTYYRLKYGVQTSNHLAANIKENYPELFHFTKRVMVHLEQYVRKKVPDEEAAYITLHFGGWLKRENKKVDSSLNAVIVCENGVGTSNMLKTQLESLIAGLQVVAIQSVREYNSQHIEADVIFSTNLLKDKGIPTIHVPAILSNSDKVEILNKVNKLFDQDYNEAYNTEQLLQVIERFATIHNRAGLKAAISGISTEQRHQKKEFREPMLNELLTEDTVILEDRVTNWEEAIRTAATPLLNGKAIKEEYIDAMIDNVKELGPYIVIAPNIALPHARPEAGVERVGMSLLRLREPVYFSEQEKHRAQLIVVLAAIDNQTHLKALSELTEMLSDDEKVEKLINSASSEDVLQLINQ